MMRLRDRLSRLSRIAKRTQRRAGRVAESLRAGGSGLRNEPDGGLGGGRGFEGSRRGGGSAGGDGRVGVAGGGGGAVAFEEEEIVGVEKAGVGDAVAELVAGGAAGSEVAVGVGGDEG